MSAQFPNINIPGDKVNAKDHVEKGTEFNVILASLVALLGSLFLIAISYGVLLIFLLIYPFIKGYIHKKAMALIHGSGVRVSETQFPQIYECFLTLKQRLGIDKDVSLYIVEANVLNAASIRYGKGNVITLTDDLIQGCLASGNPKALSFVIAHELGHIALNHTGPLRTWLTKFFKKLSRLDEYSCDSVAMALIQDNSSAFTGLLLLTVGWALLPYVNQQALAAQSEEVEKNKYSKKAERTHTHPLLLHRIHRVLYPAGKTSVVS